MCTGTLTQYPVAGSLKTCGFTMKPVVKYVQVSDTTDPAKLLQPRVKPFRIKDSHGSTLMLRLFVERTTNGLHVKDVKAADHTSEI